MSENPKRQKLRGEYPDYDKKCISCNISLRKTSIIGRKIIVTENDKALYSKFLGRSVAVGDEECSKCRKKTIRYLSKDRKLNQEKQTTVLSTSISAAPPSDILSPASTTSDPVITVTPAASTSRTAIASTSAPSTSNQAALASISNAPTSVDANVASTPRCRTTVHRSDIVNALENEIFSELSLTPSPPSTQSSDDDSSYNVAEKEAKETVEMPFKRVFASHARCCVCMATYNDTESLVVVPIEARIQVFSSLKIYIPKGNRCCPRHVIKKRFIKNEVFTSYNNFCVVSNTSDMELSEISLFLEKISIASTMGIHDKIGNFSLSEDRLNILTGFNWQEIVKIRDMLPSLRNSCNRDPLQAIAIFLTKLRTGNSDRLINAILEVKDHQIISSCCHSVITAFENDVLPTKFGIKAWSREELILHHTTEIAQKLLNVRNQLILICDGTYVYHQKSANNEYQRKAYSGQKKDHLCKPFTICTTDGFIFDIAGPFYANQNDATILRIILEDPQGLSSILREGDIFILDRGFRDVRQELEEKGFTVLMPALKGNRPRLTTEEANWSRIVTKLRWIVEAIHGIIGRRYKFLHNEIDNKTLPNVGTLCRIVCYLNNTFGKRLISDVNMSDEIVQLMSCRKSLENSLAQEVELKNWNLKKKDFQPIISSAIDDFPELSINELKLLFTGSYQLSQALCYLAEIIDENNQLRASYLKETRNILRIEVKSRHKSKKTYKCYIDYEPNKNDIEGIKRYACDCANGLRTVGCCCHVASIIYYLSNARYEANIIRPNEILSHIFDIDTAEVMPVVSESEESDSEQ